MLNCESLIIYMDGNVQQAVLYKNLQYKWYVRAGDKS